MQTIAVIAIAQLESSIDYSDDLPQEKPHPVVY